jgi:hypothetical protein
VLVTDEVSEMVLLLVGVAVGVDPAVTDPVWLTDTVLVVDAGPQEHKRWSEQSTNRAQRVNKTTPLLRVCVGEEVVVNETLLVPEAELLGVFVPVDVLLWELVSLALTVDVLDAANTKRASTNRMHRHHATTINVPVCVAVDDGLLLGVPV